MAKETKVKDIDITKSGPMTFRDLQEANQKPYTNLSPEFQSFSMNVEANTAPTSLYDARAHGEQMVATSLEGTATPWGKSMFDEPTATEAQFQELGDIRANNQPWYAKIGAGVAKGALTAGSTFLDGTVGLIFGACTAIGEGRWSGLWDNDFSKAMQSFSDWAEETMPQYRTEYQQNNPLSLDALFSANTIGDLAKVAGFGVGAFYSGAVFNLLGSAARLPKLIRLITHSVKAPKMVASGVGSFISAVNEGRIEALNNSRDWANAHMAELKANTKKQMDEALAEYEATAGKQFVRGAVEGSLIDPAYEKYKKRVAEIENSYKAAEAKIEEDRRKMGNKDLLYNIPILTASNIYNLGKLYANGYRTARRTSNIAGEIGRYRSTMSTAKGLGKATLNPLSQGLEEVEQKAASNIAGDYYSNDVHNEFYRAKIDPDAEQTTLSWINSVSQGINETVSDPETWQEFLLGALNGGAGMPRFRSVRNKEGKLQSPITLEGGFRGEYKHYMAEMQQSRELADALNARVQSPDFLNYYRGMIRHTKYQDDMDKATVKADEFEFKNAEHAQMLSDIMMFDNAGKLEDLKSAIQEAFDTSDENLESIIKNTTVVTEDGKLAGPFAEYATKDKEGNVVANLESEDSKKDMIAQLTKNKDKVLKGIDNYRKIKDDLDINTKERLSNDQLEELTWLKSQINNWRERGAQMTAETRLYLMRLVQRFDQILRLKEAGQLEEGASHIERTERYDKLEEDKRELQRRIDTINSILAENNSAITATALFVDPAIVKYLKFVIEDNQGALTEDEAQQLTTKLDDIVKLMEGTTKFNTKLKEYLSNPSKITEENERTTKNVVNEETKKKTANLKEKLAAATNMSEFRQAINENEDSDDEGNSLEGALKSLEDEGNELARNYRELNEYNAAVQKAVNSLNEDPSTKLDALKILQRQFDNSSNLEEMSNTDSVYMSDESITHDDNLSQEENAKKFQNAQYALLKAIDKVKGDSKFKDRFLAPSSRPNNPDNPENSGPGNDNNISNTNSNEDNSNRDNTEKNNSNNTPKKEFRGDDRDSTGSDKTATTPSVNSNESKNPTSGTSYTPPIGDVSSSQVEEENKETNAAVESRQSLDVDAQIKKGGGKIQYYRPTIPELHIEASKEGDFRPFDIVVNERENNVDFSGIYGYLRDSGAFRYLNEGNLKAGDELGFMIDPSFNDHTIFIIDKRNGQVVGSLDESDYSVSRYEGLKVLEEKIRREYAQRSDQPQQRQFKTDYQYDKEMSFYGGQIHGTLDRIENGTAIYVDSKGQPVILLAGKSDHQFIGIFREPNSNRWSIKMENKEGDKTIFRDMMSSVMAQLPLGAEIYERTSISVDGLRVFAQQLNHGFKIGNETYETDINGGDIANIFGLNKADQEAMEKVHISEKELPKVKEILRPYLEKFGVKNIDNVVYLTNGNTLSVKLPVLVKTRQATGTKSRGKFIASPTTRVSKVMVGKVPYSNEERSLANIPNVSEEGRAPIFGIVKKGVLSTNGKVDDSLIIKPVDMSNKEGRLYLLVPNAAGTYSPVAVRVKHFNSKEFDLNDVEVQNTPVFKDIQEAIEKFANSMGEGDVSEAFNALSSVLYTGNLHVDWFETDSGAGLRFTKVQRDSQGNEVYEEKDGKRVRKEEVKIVYVANAHFQGDITVLDNRRASDIIKDINNILLGFNLPIQVNLGMLNKGGYNNRLVSANVLTSNITQAKVIGNWFTTDYFDVEGNLHKAVNPKSKLPQPKSDEKSPVGGTESAIPGTRVTSIFSKKSYYVDLASNTIRDEQGDLVKITDKNRILFDLAWAQNNYGDATEGATMWNNKVVLPDGRVLDRTNQKYLEGEKAQEVKDKIAGNIPVKKQDKIVSEKVQIVLTQLSEDQGKVDTAKTTDKSYFIQEDDGKFHEYKRIDNTQESLDQKDSISVSAVIKRFFTSNDTSTRPDDMDEESFYTLINSLTRIRVNLEARGERFFAGNTVIYHKYNDGTRIAGKADIISVDKDGNFRIYSVSTRDARTKEINIGFYTSQLSSLKNLFESQYHASVTTLAVLPFSTVHSKSRGKTIVVSIQREPGILIKYNPAVNVPPEDTISGVISISEEPSMPIFNSAIEIMNPVNDVLDDYSLEGGKIGYFVRDGKIHRGYVTSLGKVNGVKVYMTKVPTITRGLSGKEEPRIVSTDYIAVFPNGNTITLFKDSGNTITEQKARELVKEKLEGNPKRVVSMSNEKTLIYDPLDNPPAPPAASGNSEETKNFPINPSSNSTTQGATRATQAEQAIRPKNTSRNRHRLRIITNGITTSMEFNSSKFILESIPTMVSPRNKNKVRAYLMAGYSLEQISNITGEDLTKLAGYRGKLWDSLTREQRISIVRNYNPTQTSFDSEYQSKGYSMNKEYSVEEIESLVTSELYQLPLFQKIIDIAKQFGVTVKFRNKASSDVVGGIYEDGKVIIQLSPNDPQFERTLMHELIHSAVQGVLDRVGTGELTEEQEEAVKILKEVFEDARDKYGKDTWYGLSNLSEFVAELANPEFRDFLKSQKLDNGTSLWQRIKDFFKKLIGNKLEVSDASLERLLDNPIQDDSGILSFRARNRTIFNKNLTQDEKRFIQNFIMGLSEHDRSEGSAIIYNPNTGMYYTINFAPTLKSHLENIREGRDGFEVMHRRKTLKPISNKSWKSLKSNLREVLEQKGWTAEKFDSISQRERNQVIACIAL